MALNRTQHLRMKMIAGAIVLSFVGIVCRLYYVQVFQHDRYVKLARRQHFTKVTIPVRRGSILNAAGEPLAISLPVNSLYADPQILHNKSIAAGKLAPILGEELEDVFARLIRGKRFSWVKRKLTSEQSSAIRELDITGLDFRLEYKRMYPQGLLLGQVLGFCGIDENGLAGLELTFEDELTGEPGYEVMRRSATGLHFSGSQLERVPPHEGYDVTLTIDGNIQRIVEEELDKACEKWRPSTGVAVAMDPKTGDLLAMANWPFFDPNHFTDLTAEQLRRVSHNSAVLDVYEPGSTFKPFTVCAALEEGAVTPKTIFDCEKGYARLQGHRLRDSHPHGLLSVSEILTVSSNIGMGKIALKLGEQKVYDYIRKFGFGEETGLPVGGEPVGLLYPPESWSRYTITSVPMGQEVAVSALQLVTAYSAIACNGRLMKPRLIKSYTDRNTRQVVKEFPPQMVRQVVSSETAEKVKRMLINVVEDEHGTGRRARLEGYAVAGKTGTAQKALPNGGGYSPTDYVSSFIAFAPANAPRVCVLVKLDTPHGSHYGGTVAAPAVKEIMRRVLAYLEIPPVLDRVARN